MGALARQAVAQLQLRRQRREALRVATGLLQEKQARMVTSVKMATFGAFTSRLAHDLNNPLNNLSLFLGNVVDRFESAPDGRLPREAVLPSLQGALEQAKRASTLVRNLQTFGRRAGTPRERVDVNGAISAIVERGRRALAPRAIEVVLELSDQAPVAYADRIALEQLLDSLLTTARDGSDRAAPTRMTFQTPSTGEHVGIVLRVTSGAVPTEGLWDLFEPFFATTPGGWSCGVASRLPMG